MLVLGGGFGGLTVASELADRNLPDVEITLVDQRPSYVMGLVKLWALDGRVSLEDHRRSYATLEHRGVRFVRGVVRAVDTQRSVVRVDASEIAYDYLVVALGTELAPEKLGGFGPEMNLYSEAGVEHLRHQLETLDGGRVLVMIASMPFKCPPAPYEAALLVEAMLRRRGVRDRVEIRLSSPEPHPLPVAAPEYGRQLVQLLESKRIDYQPNHQPTAIDPKQRLVHYENGDKFNFDVLLGVPLHRAPAVLREARLTDATGWIPADARTLKTTHPRIWAIGDVAGVRLPNGKLLPKAGTLAAGEGHVVATQLASELGAPSTPAAFDGKGVCYIETGDGLAIPGRGAFYAPQPSFDMGPATAGGLREKVGFEAEFMRRWFASSRKP